MRSKNWYLTVVWYDDGDRLILSFKHILDQGSIWWFTLPTDTAITLWAYSIWACIIIYLYYHDCVLFSWDQIGDMIKFRWFWDISDNCDCSERKLVTKDWASPRLTRKLKTFANNSRHFEDRLTNANDKLVTSSRSPVSYWLKTTLFCTC